MFRVLREAVTKQFIVGHDVARGGAAGGEEIATVSEHDDHVADAAEDEEESDEEERVGSVGEFAEGPPRRWWLCGLVVCVDDDGCCWFRHFFMILSIFKCAHVVKVCQSDTTMKSPPLSMRWAIKKVTLGEFDISLQNVVRYGFF